LRTETTPFSAAIDFSTGKLEPATSTVVRHLSDMRGMYRDGESERRLIEDGDPLVYEVFQYDVPERTGELLMCTTVVQPGKVGDEYFMTKGHYHSIRDRAEVYYGIAGMGQVVMMRDDTCVGIPIAPGVAAYVPPCYAHRTANTGSDPLVFLAVYPGDAGHDYGTIEQHGFRAALLECGGVAELRERSANRAA
jgi:glucose-6-phosphate isomerase